MKKYIKIILASTIITGTLLTLNSCKDSSELVPIHNKSVSSFAHYKIAEPVMLNDAETAEIQEIMKEYKENANN